MYSLNISKVWSPGNTKFFVLQTVFLFFLCFDITWNKDIIRSTSYNILLKQIKNKMVRINLGAVVLRFEQVDPMME